MSAVGQRMRRLEDRRLLRGLGHFVDDVNRVGQLWMRVFRSPHAHARIKNVQTDEALALPGVEAVLDAAGKNGGAAVVDSAVSRETSEEQEEGVSPLREAWDHAQ